MGVRFGRWQTWEYKFQWNQRTHQRGGFASKKAAEAAEWARRVEVGADSAARRGGRGAPSPPPTLFADYVQGWLDRLEQEGAAPRTLRLYGGALRRHVLPVLGARTLQELTPGVLQALYDGWRERRFSPAYIALLRAPVRGALADAMRGRLMPAIETADLGARRARRQDRKKKPGVRPLQQAERDQVLAAAERVVPAWAIFFRLMVGTGLRPGEALGLRPDDLIAPHRLRIERTWEEGRIGPTKTAETRVVEVPAAVCAALAARPGPWLFPGRFGSPLSLSAAERAFSKALREAKGGPPLGPEPPPPHRLYDLRHTFASLKLAQGAPLTWVAAQLGHTTPVTTLRFYARWIPTTGRQWWTEDRPPLPTPPASQWIEEPGE